jgi:hypothetical protein
MTRSVLAAVLLLVAQHASAGSVRVGAGALLDVGSSQLDLGCHDLEVSGVFSAGSGSTGQIRHLAIATGGAVDGSPGALEVTGDWDNQGIFAAGSGRVAFVDGCGLGSANVSGDTTFSQVSFSTNTGKTLFFEAGATQRVTGPLSMGGAEGSGLVIRSSQPGVAGFLDRSGTQTTIAWVDVQDNQAIGLPIVVGPAILGSNTLGWVLASPVPALGIGALSVLTALLLGLGARRAER